MVDITVLNNMEYADAENFVHNNGILILSERMKLQLVNPIG